MRVFIALTYYRPHYSGLTIYVERLARALVERGHHVTVLTSRFSRQLPAHEYRDGVEVIRPGVLMQISKGVIMPSMPFWAARLIRQADVVNLHVPQFDAAYLAWIGRMLGKPVVLTYHCDLTMPRTFIHQLAQRVSVMVNHISVPPARIIVTNTLDYAQQSPFLKHYLQKLHVIQPPVELVPVTDADVADFKQRYGIQAGQKVIGMAARLATEKGVEYLIEALPAVVERHPEIRVLFVGQYKDVLGEELYAQRLAPLIQRLGSHWSFLGNLPPVEFAAFFRACHLTVLPSINGTESFGMVQVESMTSGTPVIATDLPGVRQPVRESGMGQIVPPQDAASLSNAIIQMLEYPNGYQGKGPELAHHYSPATVAGEYEALFNQLIQTGKS